MRLVRSARLWFKEGTSDKLYEVDLVENDALQSDKRFLVNFRYGRRGSTLREGAKTAEPVDAVAAKKVFDSVVVSKVNEGYRRTDQPAAASQTPPPASGTPAPSEDALDGRGRELLARLAACLRSPWPARDLDRLVWRIGELKLRAAGPTLVELAERIGPAEASYSLVWALARAGQERAAPMLAEIATRTKSALTADLARFALASPLMGAAKDSSPEGEVPDTMARAATDAGALVVALHELGARAPIRVGGAMVALARSAQGDPARHAALAGALRSLPARPPYLIGLRRIFKHAEMADDAALFAVAARAFETARPMYSIRHSGRARPYVPELGLAVNVADIRGRPDTKIGLSDMTLGYLKRRIWRALRKRAEVGDRAFAELAAAYLLGLRPEDMAPPVRQTLWCRDANGRWGREERTTGGLYRNWTASQLLRRNDPLGRARYRSLTFVEASSGGAGSVERPEAFPALWDARPDLALDLAADGAVEPVSRLGVRVLAANPAHLRAADALALMRLLRSADIAAQRLGFAEARDRLAGGVADPALLHALLAADFPDARRLVVARIDREPSLPWSEADLGLAALISPHDDVAESILGWARERRADPLVGVEIARRLADWLLATAPKPEAETQALIRNVRERIAALWAAGDMPIDQPTIERLFAHPAPAVVAAGVDALALSGADVSAMPDERWAALLGSPSTDVQSAALRLFGRLDDAALAGHSPLVVAFATAPATELRRAARPLVVRLAAQDASLAERLARELIDQLFRAAPDDAFATDVVALLREATPAQVSALDPGMLWRLLQARAKGAPLLGSTELPNRPFSTFSVRQIARLGNHPHLAARRWALSAYEADPIRFQHQAEDAVLLVESDWEDAQEFAREYFERWPAEAWTPATLAVVTDSVKPEVLAFARRLLRSRLAPADVAGQLTRLLEHPAQSMHLLVTELLTEDAAASEEAFEKLLPLARIVMLQVHKGRIAKDRMSAFLLKEAMRDRDRASGVAQLFVDLSISGVARDRAAAILALRDVAAVHPHIETPLSRRVAPVRAA